VKVRGVCLSGSYSEDASVLDAVDLRMRRRYTRPAIISVNVALMSELVCVQCVITTLFTVWFRRSP